MEENKLHYHMKVRVFRKEGAFGPGVAELMHHVEETGSLSEACRCMGMAYSKGWRIMKHAEEDLGFPLMEGTRGGSRGGRTMLTEKGKDFLHRYEMFMAELNQREYAPEYIWVTMGNVLPGTKCTITHMGKESRKKRTELTNKLKYCKVIFMQALFSNENNEKERNYR